jgi:hypothetical protein
VWKWIDPGRRSDDRKFVTVKQVQATLNKSRAPLRALFSVTCKKVGHHIRTGNITCATMTLTMDVSAQLSTNHSKENAQ